MFRPRNRRSAIALLLLVLGGLWVDIDLGLWRKRDRVIEWDVHSYYAYLPAVFLYDDIRLEQSDVLKEGDFFLFWPSVAPNGNRVIKTTMGVSLLYAPFFVAGDLTARITGAPRNGWSPPYKVWLLLGGLVYFAAGLWLVVLLLRRAGYTDAVACATILLVGGGTNLFCYATQSGTASHVYSFFLVACVLLVFQRCHLRLTGGGAIALGLLMGLITLVRPVNALIVLPFVFYGISSWQGLRQRVLQLWGARVQLLVAMLLAALVWLPQLLYWRTITDSWFFNPYLEEGFFFGNPHILDGLFSFRKGWLLYTPIMAFAILGLLVYDQALRPWRVGTVVLLAVFIHVTFSWWCWWYGGAFGQRPFIDIYALLALPLAATVQWVLTRRQWWPKVLAACLAGGFIWLNIFQTYQFEQGSLHYDGMSRALYRAQFGRMEKVPEFYDLVDVPDYERARATGR